MDILFALKAILLGIIEGLTEFLPVSSTGHLIIFEHLIQFCKHTEFTNMFTMVIQLGAILAVVVLYRKKIADTLIHLFPSKTICFKKSGLYFWLIIDISCLPAAALGIPFDHLIEAKLFNPLVVACALFLGGLWMLYAESCLKTSSNKALEESCLSPKMALIIGSFQLLSLIPGMSRSASTIIGGWVAGLSTVAAAEYSFFLAIPVMLGQALLHLMQAKTYLLPIEWLALGIGFVVSFITALFVIDSFLSYLQKKPMKIFAIYRILFAFVVLGCGMLGFF